MNFRTMSCVAGAAFILAMLMIALLVPLQSAYVVNLDHRLVPANSAYLFGTDEMGRDMLSRFLAGGKYTILTGFTTTPCLRIGISYGSRSTDSAKMVLASDCPTCICVLCYSVVPVGTAVAKPFAHNRTLHNRHFAVVHHFTDCHCRRGTDRLGELLCAWPAVGCRNRVCVPTRYFTWCHCRAHDLRRRVGSCVTCSVGHSRTRCVAA